MQFTCYPLNYFLFFSCFFLIKCLKAQTSLQEINPDCISSSLVLHFYRHPLDCAVSPLSHHHSAPHSHVHLNGCTEHALKLQRWEIIRVLLQLRVRVEWRMAHSFLLLSFYYDDGFVRVQFTGWWRPSRTPRLWGTIPGLGGNSRETLPDFLLCT